MKKQFLLISSALISVLSFTNAQIDGSKVSLYLPFDGNISDLSGKNVVVNPSTNAAATGTVTYEEGKFGQCGVFALSPIVTTNIDFVSDKDYTICTWLNMAVLPSVTNAGQTWLQQKDVTTPATSTGRILLEALKGNYYGSNGNNVRLDHKVDQIPVILEINKWYHVAIIQNATENKKSLYVDGVFIKDTVMLGTVADASNNGQLVIGGAKAESGNAVIKSGSRMDDLLITREALSAETIKTIMTNGVASALATGIRTNKGVKPAGCFYSSNLLTVTLGQAENLSKVELFSVTGQRVMNDVMSGANCSFHISLNKGIYLMKVSGSKTQSTVKFAVN